MVRWSLEISNMPDVCMRPALIDLIDWASKVYGAGQILGTALEEIDEGGSPLHHAVRSHLGLWQ